VLSLRWLLPLWIVFGFWAAPASAARDSHERVQVADPYLELHTGPGRGYPVTQVVERGEWVEILGRMTDWFKIRTAQGREGWVSRAQIERTTTEAGVQKSFRDVLLDDYLNRRLEVGFAGGVIESDPYMMVRVGYRFNDNLSAEIAMGQVTGDFSSSTLYYVAILSRPFPDWAVSPFFSLGLGRFNNTPRATLVGAIATESNMANAALGLEYYLTQRFYLRADYRRHIVFVDENRINEYNEMSLGVGFFF
jgi:hypothetical protein